MPIQKFTSELLEKKKHTEDVYTFKFSSPKNFEFEAGQYVQMQLAEKCRKSYSILNAPSEKGIIELCLKILKHEGTSTIILEKAKIGTKFEMMGPMGLFKFNEKDENDEYWFLGAGTGVTPLYSMIKEYIPKYKNKKFVLLFGVRKKENLFLLNELKELETTYKNFEFKPVLSREKEGWNGFKGHVQNNLPQNLQKKSFYICGVGEMVNETESLLKKKGVKKDNIHREKYS